MSVSPQGGGGVNFPEASLASLSLDSQPQKVVHSCYLHTVHTLGLRLWIRLELHETDLFIGRSY